MISSSSRLFLPFVKSATPIAAHLYQGSDSPLQPAFDNIFSFHAGFVVMDLTLGDRNDEKTTSSR